MMLIWCVRPDEIERAVSLCESIFGSISVCSCIVFHYCVVLNIKEEEEERKNGTKTTLVVAKNGAARNTFTRCEKTTESSLMRVQKPVSFRSPRGCLVLICELCEETLHTFILDESCRILSHASCLAHQIRVV